MAQILDIGGSLGGLMAVYDQHDYMGERLVALNRWTEFLLNCEAGRPQPDVTPVPLRIAA